MIFPIQINGITIMAQKVTLKDIANDTGLSISTVSRALSQSGKISKINEKKVFESAHRLNYSLINIPTPVDLKVKINIALITKHHTGEFYASLFDGIDKASNGNKASISLISVANSKVPPLQTVSELRNSRYDALIIFLPNLNAEDYLELIKIVPKNYPIVSIAPIANPVIDTVTFDNYRGGYLVANHFKELGYKNLGIIKGPFKKSEAMLRKNGFIDVINASDDLNLTWEYDGDYSFRNGKFAYSSFKSMPIKPDAIFCGNDSMALGFLHNAIRDGVHIPRDVAVAGFDDLPTCELYTPTITSVHTSYEILGKKTLELIFNRLENSLDSSQSGFTSLIPVSLNVRESSTELNHVFEKYYPNTI